MIGGISDPNLQVSSAAILQEVPKYHALKLWHSCSPDYIMEAWHPLKTLLQIQLASDTQAVVHLPYILSTLRAEDLTPSEHTQKWIARLNSLIPSKDGEIGRAHV